MQRTGREAAAIYGMKCWRRLWNKSLDFIEQAGESLEKVFITMGEPKSSLFLAQRAKDFLGVNASVPEKDQIAEIDF